MNFKDRALLLKELAMKTLEENRSFDCGQDKWKRKVVENNIISLNSTLTDINHILKSKNRSRREEAIQFFENRESQTYSQFIASLDLETSINIQKLLSSGNLFLIERRIIDSTLISSIFFDIELLTHLNVGDHNRLVLNSDISALKRCLNEGKDSLIAALKEFKMLDRSQVELYDSALSLSNTNKYLSSNILLLTLLESVSVSLIEYVYSKQHPEMSVSDVKEEVQRYHSSLNKLIEKINLKSDIEISFIDSISTYRFSFAPKLVECRKALESHKIAIRTFRDFLFSIYDLTQSRENISEASILKLKSKLNRLKCNIDDSAITNINDKVYISIKPKLEFLRKSIYSDRNQMLHGRFGDVHHDAKNYVYLMANVRLLKIFKEMQLKYECN